MSWLQLHFQVAKEQSELCESYLYVHDALSITLSDAGDQPLLEPAPGTSPMWDEVIVTALFAKDAPSEAIVSAVSSQCDVSRAWADTLEEQTWETVWMSHFTPIDCGHGLWVVPKWLDAPNPSATNILLDPGLAFGTGHHASTKLCLSWLAKLAKEGELQGKTIIDYGCGSGILAIGALLLGAKCAYAVDIDPQAVHASTQNAQLNGVADKLFAYLPQDFHNEQKNKPVLGDVICANILAKPLMGLAEYFSTLGASGTQIVLAGIIKPQLTDILAAYAPWFGEQSIAYGDEGEWLSVSFKRL